MEARKLLYALAACSPVVLLALLAISGRFLVLPWQFAEYGSSVHRDILAYRLPMMLEQSLADGEYNNSPETVEAAAQIWIAGWEKGALRAIPPAAAQDFGGGGIRLQIESSRRRLMGMMLRASRNIESTGDKERASRMYLTTLKLSNVLKYSSPTSAMQSSGMQVVCLEELSRSVHALKPSSIARMREELQELKPDSHELSRLYEQLEVLSRMDKKLARSAVLADTDLNSLLAMNNEDITSVAKGDTDQSYLVAMIRGAFQTEDRYSREIEAFLKAGITDPTVETQPTVVSLPEPKIRLFAQKGSAPGLLVRQADLAAERHPQSSK